ncbi:hypothetical protein LTR28_003387 [Elasticomyces elasticus]|nr:hypothetical protein LTR28_003387 [Elasticomyces elasticus]
MPMLAPRHPHVRYHPGSSEHEIAQEPNWGSGHQHRIGFRNRQNRFAGLTHPGDHDPYRHDEDRKFAEKAMREHREISQEAKKGDLLNFQQIAQGQTYRKLDQVRSRLARYAKFPDTTGCVNVALANIQQRERKKQQEKEEAEKKKQQSGEDTGEEDRDEEHDWRHANPQQSEKHHGAYGKFGDGSAKHDGKQQNGNQQNREHETPYQKLREVYSPEEITLLRHLQHERDQVKALQQNDGQDDSPVRKKSKHIPIAIDAIDAITPDNWIPRSGILIRNSGQHPLNAEPRLEALFSAGLITPNDIHYVRNHGNVPRLYWDTHTLDICDGALKLSMDDLKTGFEAFNIPVALACDGNRRGEMNMIKRSKGFSWGPGAVSCAYWKGALLADVLAVAGIQRPKWNGKRNWVNFEGADQPSEGKYQTSIPIDYCLDPTNDMMLAYEMNNTPLPPDHGFPVRLIIPGFVGGRCIKWLARIWITDHENDSYYHIWDNRVLPSFVTEKDGEFARAMFNHPSTACMEQNLNSVIVRPGQGQKLDLVEVLKRDTYRVEGFAYEGGGHEIQRVELTLDNSQTWLYCLRHFPERPIRHGRKFWIWIHWHIDVDSAHFARAESLTVRCFNVFKNTQPEKPVWNLMGMMNNGWYTVKSSTDKDGKLTFRHPYDPEGNGEGWMVPSTENQLAAAKQNSNAPDKQFTRQEIESHNSKDDAWLVIGNNVYDVTSVLSWHPGGSATILANAGKLSLELTSSFESIHDDYAHKKLQECVIGRVTGKAANFMREQAKAEAKNAAKLRPSDVLLQSKKWLPVKLVDKKQISKDTFTYTFSYKDYSKSRKQTVKLGLGTCQHIQFGIHMLDKMLIRSYTPTRPITQRDEDGTFDLTVKTYFPDENQPGGALSNFLHELPIGKEVEVCGPTGEIEYLGDGVFDIEGKTRTFTKVNLILGGSGLTPGYSLLKSVLEGKRSASHPGPGSDITQIRVIDGNKTEADILLHEELDQIEKQSQGQIKIVHVLDHPDNKDEWEKKGGLSGYVNADIIRNYLFPPPTPSPKPKKPDDEDQDANAKEGAAKKEDNSQDGNGKRRSARSKKRDDSNKDGKDKKEERNANEGDVVTFLCGPPAMIQKAALPALKGDFTLLMLRNG